GGVQGSPIEGNTGDAKAALASYRKALVLRDSIGDDRVPDVVMRTSYLFIITDLAMMEQNAGDMVRVKPLCEKAVALAEAWMAAGSGDADFLAAAANAYTRTASNRELVR